MGAFAIASAHQVVIKRALAESLSPGRAARFGFEDVVRRERAI